MQSFKVNCVLIATIVLWASAFVGIRVGLVAYSPGALALLRFIVASMCMAILYHQQKIKTPMPWTDRFHLLFAGAVGVGIYSLCLNMGEQSVTAGIASFVIGLMPVLTICLSSLFLNEKIRALSWLGIGISLFGLVVLMVGDRTHPGMEQGVVFILVSALSGSYLTIRQKHFLAHYSSIAIAAWVMWGGTLLLLIYTPPLIREIQSADYQATIAAIYMGIFPAALAFLTWSYVLKNLPASQATMTLYSLPIVSTLLGFLYLNETPSSLSLVGGCIALTGAFIAYCFELKNRT